MKKLNLILGIIIGITLFSCSNDDDNNETPIAENELVGIWVRIDSNNTFEERYTFNSNQTGNVYFLDGSFENSTDFTWTSENNVLTVTTNDSSGDFSAPYEINSNAQLVLANDSELTYNKIE